ncbi:RND efflux system, membrane fusion protein [hydrothermal vent metagenome]|uniref:RND efflux system, membrane fusion protein n=1 Tax=hydrothermal vent metagenome TaxID=652676 RepID=A0A3B1AEN7_9ZZZZ
MTRTTTRPLFSYSWKIMLAFGLIGTAVFLKFVYADETETAKVAKPPAMPVEVTLIKSQNIRIWKKFSGRLTAVDYVEIRPQVSGLITEIKFNDGQMVAKGDVLYIIDPRSFTATAAKAEANLVAARKRYSLADKEYKRSKNLINTKVISQRIYDERINTRLVTAAEVKSAEAQLTEAEVNLDHAYIKAPVSGRLSRSEITVGNLVSAGSNPPLLTTIVSSKNIYADFEIDEQTYLNYIRDVRPAQDATAIIPVKLHLQDGKTTFSGKMHAFDNKINPASGTIRARAIFDNPQGTLLPGMYAHIELGSATEKERILVSERAIGTDQNRKFVYIVNGENKTTYREVQLGDSIDGHRVIRSGLNSGDKVITRGLIRIRPNMLVAPKISTTKKTANNT